MNISSSNFFTFHLIVLVYVKDCLAPMHSAAGFIRIIALVIEGTNYATLHNRDAIVLNTTGARFFHRFEKRWLARFESR